VAGFRKFLFRGNLIDLAVAVVIGVAFNTVVQALIADIITPLIAAIGGKPNFGTLSFTVNHSQFHYGSFINAVLSFVIIAGVIYYLVVSPATRITALAERRKEATEWECPQCLSSIPVGAKRCMYCTSEVPPVGGPSGPGGPGAPGGPGGRHATPAGPAS
jgi:large conductance mechanosensitive channel